MTLSRTSDHGPPTVLDLFCGAGGWSEGARGAGLDPVGLDTDADACRTSRAAGHTVVRADVSAYPPDAFAPVGGADRLPALYGVLHGR